jgi:hypothetical protein
MSWAASEIGSPRETDTGNEDAWRAFNIARMCRHIGMAAGPFDWAGVEAKLTLVGLWTPEIMSRLTVCEMAMLSAEHESREDQRTPPRKR